jgi:DNA-binding PadR family transcriptional regulator
MARRPDALSRIDILVLSTLARAPMHGYELKLELRYKHVRWWAKCEHGHLYAALARLERRGDLRRVAGGGDAERRRVYAITASGLRRTKRWLGELGAGNDTAYFDVDLFLASAHVLERGEALEILEQRRGVLQAQHTEATQLREQMGSYVPVVAQLVMAHRIDHLAAEVVFVERAIAALRAEASWGPFLGDEPIRDFVRRTGVPLEK